MLSPELALAELEAGETTSRTTASIVGLGMALPERVVTNDEIGRTAGVDDRWIQRRSGIAQRRHAGTETTTSLAADAGRAALADAGVQASEIDLVVVATMTPEFATPSTAPLVAANLGIPHTGAFDVNAACTGWLSALSITASLIETGRASTALVIGAETLSKVLDLEDRMTAPLFADGAGAAVLSGRLDRGGRVGPVVLGSDGTSAEHIVCPIGGPVRMDGHATFQRAVVAMSEASAAACAQAGIGLHDVDLVVPHQANSRIISAVGERLGLPPERVVDVIADTGNTSAATLPIALTIAQAQGRIPANGHVLLAAFGAGLTWGAAVLDFDQGPET